MTYAAYDGAPGHSTAGDATIGDRAARDRVTNDGATGGGRERVGLIVDGGATRLRMGVVDVSTGMAGTAGPETVVRQVEVEGFQWTAGEDPVRQQRARVVAAWEELGRPEPVSVIALGLAGGAADPASRRRLAPELAAALGTDDVLLTSDAVTTHLGVLGGAPGVVISAGTGVACLAVTAEGDIRNVDGLGYLFGDVGGGFWLGRAGIQAALDALERGGPATRLVDELEEWIRAYVDSDRAAEPLREQVKVLYAAPTLIAEVASFGSIVIAAAGDDHVAAELCRRAGRELAGTAAGAVHASFPGAPAESVQVSWSGSILRSADPIFAGFTEELARLAPATVVTQPDGDAMRGAALLAGGAEVPHLAAVVGHEVGGVR